MTQIRFLILFPYFEIYVHIFQNKTLDLICSSCHSKLEEAQEVIIWCYHQMVHLQFLFITEISTCNKQIVFFLIGPLFCTLHVNPVLIFFWIRTLRKNPSTIHQWVSMYLWMLYMVSEKEFENNWDEEVVHEAALCLCSHYDVSSRCSPGRVVDVACSPGRSVGLSVCVTVRVRSM